MRILFAAFCCAAFLAFPPHAFAQRKDQLPQKEPSAAPTVLATAPAARPVPVLSEGIAAVVNDSVISTGDVRARLGLTLLSSGMPDAPEVRQKLLPQILRVLIEESLQLQEGQRTGIDVSGEEIDAAMAKIAQDNKMNVDMRAFLDANGVAPSTLERQIRAGLTWNKIVMRELRPRVDVGDDEVKAAVENIKANAGKQEYLVSEILLSVDKPEDELQVRAFADKLVEQLKGGAMFSAVARQFSQGTGASAGGDMGWIRAGELAGEVDALLQTMTPPQIAGPVRSVNGYHILGLRNKRVASFGDAKDARVRMGQLFKAFKNEAEHATVIDESRSVRAAFSGCEGIDKTLGGFKGWEWQDLGEVALDQAPPWLFEEISKLAVGEISAPMPANDGVLLVCLCARETATDIDVAALRNAIGAEKMERMARGLLRDLRRDAFLDVRLKDVP